MLCEYNKYSSSANRQQLNLSKFIQNNNFACGFLFDAIAHDSQNDLHPTIHSGIVRLPENWCDRIERHCISHQIGKIFRSSIEPVKQTENDFKALRVVTKMPTEEQSPKWTPVSNSTAAMEPESLSHRGTDDQKLERDAGELERCYFQIF